MAGCRLTARKVTNWGFAVQRKEADKPFWPITPRSVSASLSQGLGQRLCIARRRDHGGLDIADFGEHEECGVTRLGMCHEMAVSLSDIFQAT